MTSLRAAVLVAVAALLLWKSAFAQASVTVTASAEQVELGEPFQIELKAMTTADAAPTNAVLPPPSGMRVSGPSIGTQQRISFVNGQVERQTGITATWTLVASQLGTFVIGPASVEVQGKRISANTVSVQIVAAGTLPSRRSRRRSLLFDFDDDSFDPFGMLRGPRRGRQTDPTADALFGTPSGIPEEYRVERAEDPVAFLRAEVTPSSAVVGQQMTLRIYAYDSRGPFEETGTSEPSRADFLSHMLVNGGHRQPIYRLALDGRLFHGVKIREVALFPLRAGRLSIGPMKMGFKRPGSPLAQGDGIVTRHSRPLEVTVTEPPLAGRPAGYQLGTVGRFSLSARVDPPAITAGEAVSVVLSLEGTGALPSDLVLPQKTGVEWAKPRITEELTTANTLVGGKKTFAYVVRIDTPGRVDLGEVLLPYFDPRAGRYATARATLGEITVTPSPVAKRDSDLEPPKSSLLSLLAPRTHLGQASAAPLRLADRSWFWVLLAMGPLGVLSLGGGVRAAKHFRDRLKAQRSSLTAKTSAALAEAGRAAKAEDVAATAAAAERAVYATLEDRFGLRARGVLRAELSHRLVACGLSEELARDTVATLDTCENARFVPASTTASDLFENATRVVDALRQKPLRERAQA